ncbi:MAG: hypothetical protein Q8Q20_03415 [bacterium]|nr:hypothetical protein [bacterium]
MPEGAKNSNVNADEKLLAAFSYLYVLSVIILVVKRDSDFVKKHATQGLVLFIAAVIISFIPLLNVIFHIVIFLMIIMGFVKALSGEWWEMPVIGSLAKKINL